MWNFQTKSYSFGLIECLPVHMCFEGSLATRLLAPGPVAQSDARPTGIQEVVGSSLEIGHEMISMAILFLPLIQVGHLSVTGRSMCT